jgi:hypothetical protein
MAGKQPGDVMVELATPSAPFLFSTLINWLSEIGRENYQLALLILLAVWLAYRLAAGYAFHVFGMDEFKQAGQMIWGLKNPSKRRNIVLQNGEEKVKPVPPARALFGGQISLWMDARKGYAAVLEQTAAKIETYGPQDEFPIHPPGFLRLRQIVDLQDNRVEVTVAAKTKDGIPVTVSEAYFVCRLKGALLDVRKSAYLSCDKRQVEKLVFRHWIGQDWENQTKRRKALRDLISTALQDFIARRIFFEVLAEIPNLANTIRDIRLEPRLLEQFAGDFSENSGDHGLQLVWTGRAEWQLPGLFNPVAFQDDYRALYIDWMRSQHNMRAHTGIDIQRREIERLIRHVLKIADNLRQDEAQEDKIILELTQHYFERIQSAIHLIESRGDKPPREWVSVAQYLKQIAS